MRAFTIAACVALFWPVLLRMPSNPRRPAPAGQAEEKFVDSVMVAVVGRNRRPLQIEFYHRGPLPRRAGTWRNQYVRGIEVATAEGVELGRWEAPPTPLPCSARANACFSALDGVWPVRPGGPIITTLVLYRARSLRFWAFRWTGARLKTVGSWKGANFSLRVFGGKLVVSVKPLDYDKVPRLYAWNGRTFAESTHQMPFYYARLGRSYTAAIVKATGAPGDFVRECGLALQAYQLAGPIKLGRNACAKARERIKAGRGVVPHRGLSPERFEDEKLAALAQIDRLLKQYSQPPP